MAKDEEERECQSSGAIFRRRLELPDFQNKKGEGDEEDEVCPKQHESERESNPTSQKW